MTFLKIIKSWRQDSSKSYKTMNKQKGAIDLLILLAVTIIAAAIPVATKLVQERQEMRKLASIDEPCWVCEKGECVLVASPPECSHDLNECFRDDQCGALATATPSPRPRYDCDQNGRCIQSPSGSYLSLGSCQADCQASAPPTATPGETVTSTPVPQVGCTNPSGRVSDTRCSDNETLAICTYNQTYQTYYWHRQVCPYGCQQEVCLMPTPTLPTGGLEPTKAPTPTSQPTATPQPEPTNILIPTPASGGPAGCDNPAGKLGDARCSDNETLAVCAYSSTYQMYYWQRSTCPDGCQANKCQAAPTATPTLTPTPTLSLPLAVSSSAGTVESVISTTGIYGGVTVPYGLGSQPMGPLEVDYYLNQELTSLVEAAAFIEGAAAIGTTVMAAPYLYAYGTAALATAPAWVAPASAAVTLGSTAYTAYQCGQGNIDACITGMAGGQMWTEQQIIQAWARGRTVAVVDQNVRRLEEFEDVFPDLALAKQEQLEHWQRESLSDAYQRAVDQYNETISAVKATGVEFQFLEPSNRPVGLRSGRAYYSPSDRTIIIAPLGQKTTAEIQNDMAALAHELAHDRFYLALGTENNSIGIMLLNEIEAYQWSVRQAYSPEIVKISLARLQDIDDFLAWPGDPLVVSQRHALRNCGYSLERLDGSLFETSSWIPPSSLNYNLSPLNPPVPLEKSLVPLGQ